MKRIFTYVTLLVFATGLQGLKAQEDLVSQKQDLFKSSGNNDQHGMVYGKDFAELPIFATSEDHDKGLNTAKISPEDRHHDYYQRTSMNLLLAAGLNNAIESGESIDDSDFKFWGSRFFEIGLAWNTRVFEDSNWLRLKYGFSFQFNGLKPTDNRFFVENEDITELETYPTELKKAKFRMDNLVIPLHFEFGPSTRIEDDGTAVYDTYGKFKMGVGGYAGFSVGERQKLKYENNGNPVKEKQKGDFNTNDFIYGVSTYIGWGATSLYAKYDLNSIFEEPNTELNNISLGLRLDLY